MCSKSLLTPTQKREGSFYLFLVPVSPPVHYAGVENRDLFCTGDIGETPFYAGSFSNSMHVRPKHVHSYKAGLHQVCIQFEAGVWVLCTSIQNSQLCIRLMLKIFHFVCIQYRVNGAPAELRRSLLPCAFIFVLLF